MTEEEANTLVSMDLADPGLIRRNKEFLKILVKNDIDIVLYPTEFLQKDSAGIYRSETSAQDVNNIMSIY